MSKLYILIERNLETDYFRVADVFETKELAEAEMKSLTEFYEGWRSYNIEEKVMR